MQLNKAEDDDGNLVPCVWVILMDEDLSCYGTFIDVYLDESNALYFCGLLNDDKEEDISYRVEARPVL